MFKHSKYNSYIGVEIINHLELSKAEKEELETNTLEEMEKEYIYNKALDVINEENIFEIMSLIPKPFVTKAEASEADILSSIYDAFLTHTEVPTALPIFGFLSFVSAYCVKNNITYKIPFDPKVRTLDTWTTVLAPSGSSKTLSISQIQNLIPTDVNGEKIITNNFKKANGPAKFIEELADLPTTPDGKSQYGFWIQDEVAQMFKQVEREGTPLSEIKEYLLEAYDHKSLERKNKQSTIKTKEIILTTLFINTFDSYVSNISLESLSDGLMRRFNLVYSEKDERDFTDYSFYKMANLIEDLADKFYTFFDSIESDQQFTFSKDCVELYQKYFKIYWHKKYKNVLAGRENFYRTYMMESFKFAIFYHFILGKKGTEIDSECLMYGMKISLLFADSVKKFFDAKLTAPSAKVFKAKSDLDKFIAYLNDNLDIKMRDFTRKFTIKKADALIILRAIKNSGKITHHPLFNDLEPKVKKGTKPTLKVVENPPYDDDTSIFETL